MAQLFLEAVNIAEIGGETWLWTHFENQYNDGHNFAMLKYIINLGGQIIEIVKI